MMSIAVHDSVLRKVARRSEQLVRGLVEAIVESRSCVSGLVRCADVDTTCGTWVYELAGNTSIGPLDYSEAIDESAWRLLPLEEKFTKIRSVAWGMFFGRRLAAKVADIEDVLLPAAIQRHSIHRMGGGLFLQQSPSVLDDIQLLVDSPFLDNRCVVDSARIHNYLRARDAIV